MFDNNNTAPVRAANINLFAITDFPGYYADVEGNIWSGKRGAYKKLARSVTQTGYLMVKLMRDGRAHSKYVHSLILSVFVGPRPDGDVACHYPSPIKTNCGIGNLMWASRTVNAQHAAEHGTTRGRSNKLTTDAVRAIRDRSAKGESNSSLSRAFKCGLDNIRFVIARKTWKHVV